ncbi:DEAD/DEAH box helicase family protein [Apibacter raozihei]|uniref:DEAD/DEAH box helicase n=1 Tax=Apibacter raozihei TaxID=2500547 RepID=UPI000FE37762|nr:DEAD/DEAH box helicase family protein [Apibacter raozihei]
MNITLPSLIKEFKFDGLSKKNLISHLISEEITKDFIFVLRNRNKLVLKDKNNIEYFFTTDKNYNSQDYEYILLVKSFTQRDIDNSTIQVIKWIKHPLNREYTSQDVIRTWEGKFNFKQEDISNGILGLRTPQIGAIYSVLGHLTNATDIANVVLPTGTGKTETMLSVLVANKCEKLLVAVPSDALRSQLANKFIDFGWLKKKDKNNFSILDNEAMYPIVGIINSGFKTIEELTHFLSKCNVVISTMNLLSSRSSEEIELISGMFTHLFVDEAHHSKANNWNNFIGSFEKRKVVQFTATPYRNDGQMLDGKIVYNFTLKEAQEQGYFKQIDFIPVREYEPEEADKKISEVAIARLREDLNKGYDHILMVRCDNHQRADNVFKKYYEQYSDLSPVVIHSDVENLNQVKQNIIDKKYRIIVCVDMLGEGFDLPELKIAAFHDVRKSLPITLQFAGRFTRTNKDNNLGNASFIANMYQPKIDDIISVLYTRESNWNTILPNLSLQATQEQIDLKEILEGFDNLEEFIIPLSEIRPAFSTVIYKNNTDSWNPGNFKEGIRGYENYDYKFNDINRKKKIIIALLGSKKPVDWSKSKDVYAVDWDIYIVYWDSKNNLLFIHSSDKGSLHESLADSIIDDALLIRDKNVFKSLYQIDRLKISNLGLRKGLGKNITFQSYYGRGVQEGLSLSEEKAGINNNLSGYGFENGEVSSIGVSRKGRIWSHSRGTINNFIHWCNKVGGKISNKDIDGDEILLKNTIKPKKISEKPDAVAITADWNPDVYRIENSLYFDIDGSSQYDLSNTELNMVIDENSDKLEFIFSIEGKTIPFEIKLSKREIGTEDEYLFEVEKIDKTISTQVIIGSKTIELEEFFTEYPPIIWFNNGAYLYGNDYVVFREEIVNFPKEELIDWDWSGVSIKDESEGFATLKQDSIQYFCIEKFILEDYDIIFNDDNSGEIADIIAIKNENDIIRINLYHLKYALKGKVSNEIKNLYEVCGQTQKSLIWRHKERNEEFFDRLLKRENKKNKKGETRLRKGTIEDLEKFYSISKIKPVKFDIYIVQPSISKRDVSQPILYQLGVTANHLKKEGNIDLKVISNL